MINYVLSINEDKKIKGFLVEIDTEHIGGQSYYIPIWDVEVREQYSDVISRQAVFDLIKKYTRDMSTDHWSTNYGVPNDILEQEVEDLPPIILTQTACPDVISRQAAIEAIKDYFDRIRKAKRGNMLTCSERAIELDINGLLNGLPSVAPEPKEVREGEEDG